MLRRITHVALLCAIATVLFHAGVVQEWNRDEIPERARVCGSKLPLQDPHLVITVHCLALELWDGDVLVKRYDAAFGRARISGRTNRETPSTPIGEYRVVKKERKPSVLDRGSRFLQLNYPNEADVASGLDGGLITREEWVRGRDAARAGGPVPVIPALGGPLGIQGNYFFFRDRFFTDGSVGLANGDMNELFDHVPVGTLVEIRE